jgi:hypothetical protein
MRGERFRLAGPTIAVLFSEGRKTAIIVPAGETIKAVNDPTEGNPVLDVEWDGKILEMFVQDIRERGERVRSASF